MRVFYICVYVNVCLHNFIVLIHCNVKFNSVYMLKNNDSFIKYL